jgi:ketosteroid isomerase-like protein
MGLADRYREYARAFEDAYADDDWSRLAAYFTEDAVYDGGEGPDAVARGRGALLARLKSGVDAFDRRFDARKLRFLEEPKEEAGRVRARLELECTKAGAPPCVIACTETAAFEGDRIRELRDEFDDATLAAMETWMSQHGAFLQDA